MNKMTQSRLLIITYHYIRNSSQYPFPGIHPMELDEFRRQIEWLNNNFHIASPEEVEEFELNKVPLPEPSIFITFDDGLSDHMIAAEQVLDPMGIKGAFFISTRPLIEKKALMVHKVHWLRATTDPELFKKQFLEIMEEKFPEETFDEAGEIAIKTYPYDTLEDANLKYWINSCLPAEKVDIICSELLIRKGISEPSFCSETYMNENQILTLSQNGHAIGAHGHTHTPFSRLSNETLKWEIDLNKSYLEKIITQKVLWISYPYGMKWSIPENSDSLWKRLGFKIGISLDKEDFDWNYGNESPFWLKRINPNIVENICK